MPESFGVKDLGEKIVKILGLQVGENVEICKDRVNPNRVMVIRYPLEEQRD